MKYVCKHLQSSWADPLLWIGQHTKMHRNKQTSLQNAEGIYLFIEANSDFRTTISCSCGNTTLHPLVSHVPRVSSVFIGDLLLLHPVILYFQKHWLYSTVRLPQNLEIMITIPWNCTGCPPLTRYLPTWPLKIWGKHIEMIKFHQD